MRVFGTFGKTSIARQLRSPLAGAWLSVAAALALGSAANAADDLKLIAPGELTVVALSDQPGTSFVDAKGENQGMAIDLMNAIAAKLGVRHWVSTMAFAQ